jgi:hypothetical protein
MIAFGRERHASMLLVQRYECKYMLTEGQAIAVRNYLRPFLAPDSHATADGRYDVYSVYLDDAKWSTYWWSVVGQKDRFKLRMRTYGMGNGGRTFLEIKLRIDRISHKRRAIMSWDDALHLLADPAGSKLSIPADEHFDHANAAAFRQRMLELGATPRVAVAYQREAWHALHQPSVRITFDRAIRTAEIVDPRQVKDRALLWRYVEGPEVLLEIKFTNTFPQWISSCIQRFELQRQSFAKYVAAVNLLHNDTLAKYEMQESQ